LRAWSFHSVASFAGVADALRGHDADAIGWRVRAAAQPKAPRRIV